MTLNQFLESRGVPSELKTFFTDKEKFKVPEGKEEADYVAELVGKYEAEQSEIWSGKLKQTILDKEWETVESKRYAATMNPLHNQASTLFSIDKDKFKGLKHNEFIPLIHEEWKKKETQLASGGVENESEWRDKVQAKDDAIIELKNQIATIQADHIVALEDKDKKARASNEQDMLTRALYDELEGYVPKTVLPGTGILLSNLKKGMADRGMGFDLVRNDDGSPKKEGDKYSVRILNEDGTRAQNLAGTKFVSNGELYMEVIDVMGIGKRAATRVDDTHLGKVVKNSKGEEVKVAPSQVLQDFFAE